MLDAAVHMLVDGVRNRHAARIGKPLDAGRDIDAVAVKIAAVDHDVAEIDADAQHDAPIRRVIFVRGGHGLLQLDRAFDGVDGAAELDEHAIADSLEDAALMAGDERLHHLAPPHLQFRQRGCFVPLHEPAVADHVRGQNGDEPALNAFVLHISECFSKVHCVSRVHHANVVMPRLQVHSARRIGLSKTTIDRREHDKASLAAGNRDRLPRLAALWGCGGSELGTEPVLKRLLGPSDHNGLSFFLALCPLTARLFRN